MVFTEKEIHFESSLLIHPLRNIAPHLGSGPQLYPQLMKVISLPTVWVPQHLE